MMYQATVVAYDYLDKVGVSVNVYLVPPAGGSAQGAVYHKVVTVRGTGEDNVEEWLKDALVALLEEL